MDQRSVFHEEWLRSLREQYKHVIRKQDHVTLSSLTAVMHNVGFRADELTQLRIEATMHVDQVGDGFVADQQILDAGKLAQAHPAECLCPQCMNVDEARHDADGQPIALDPEEDAEGAAQVFPVADPGGADAQDDSEPVTFEDSVAADESLREDDEIADAPEDEDDEQADPDAPQQINLF
ncbi:MAG: hypothetical protein OXN88_03005 [Chloroflexota bacterium]|nr:hypothetical protein [Chloroflexota bacterium]